MVCAFLRVTRALKANRAGFIAFAQKKYGYSKELILVVAKFTRDVSACQPRV